MDTALNIYTDGGAIGNPGLGGIGFVICDITNKIIKKECMGFKKSTNNRMELTAVIQALNTIKTPHTITIYSDSNYIVSAFNKKWIDKWISNNWKKRVNKDLWLQLLDAIHKHKSVKFKWIKAHAGHELNELCDSLVKQGATGKCGSLIEDKGYLNEDI